MMVGIDESVNAYFKSKPEWKPLCDLVFQSRNTDIFIHSDHIRAQTYGADGLMISDVRIPYLDPKIFDTLDKLAKPEDTANSACH